MAVRFGAALALAVMAAWPGVAASATPDRLSASADPTARQTMLTVQLRGRHQAELERIAISVSDPRSPRYGRFLTRRRVRMRYAPPSEVVDAVRTWARSHGLRVVHVAANRHAVVLRGAPAAAPVLPAALARHVSHVDGPVPVATAQQQQAAPLPAPIQAPPCSRFWSERMAHERPAAFGRAAPWVLCGYEPEQVRSAYGLDGLGLDGAGQTVGIVSVGSSPTVEDDVQAYARRHALPPVELDVRLPPGGGESIHVYGDTRSAFWMEQALEIEAVHAVAPAARIVYQAASADTRTAVTVALNELVSSGPASIVTLGYYSPSERAIHDGVLEAEAEVLRQAAAQGIGVYAAAGDTGDNTRNALVNNSRQVTWPATHALVTAVGGTSLAIDAAGRRVFETPWGTGRSTLVPEGWSPAPPGDFLNGTGGGTSQNVAQPEWQQGVVPDSIAYYYRDHEPYYTPATVPGRAVPDVAAVGDDHTGFVIGHTLTQPDGTAAYGEYRQGGTSLSMPVFAAIMALADQAAGSAHGFASPALYALAGTEAFHDVEPGQSGLAQVRNHFINGRDTAEGLRTTLNSLGQILTLHLLDGYDDSTGLGTPNGAAFIRALAPGWTPPPRQDPPPVGPAPSRCSAAVVRLPRLRGDRIVRVRARARGRVVARARGRRLRSLRVPRPASAPIRVSIRMRSARGRSLRVRRTIRPCRAG